MSPAGASASRRAYNGTSAPPHFGREGLNLLRMRGSTRHAHLGHARLRCHGTDTNSRLSRRPLVEASRHDRRSEILTLQQGQGSEMASLLARNAAVLVAMDGERRSPSPSTAAGHNSGAPAAAAPHYNDHCSPLRERVLKAGIESLPDYELLELLLHPQQRRLRVAANRRRDQLGQRLQQPGLLDHRGLAAAAAAPDPPARPGRRRAVEVAQATSVERYPTFGSPQSRTNNSDDSSVRATVSPRFPRGRISTSSCMSATHRAPRHCWLCCFTLRVSVACRLAIQLVCKVRLSGDAVANIAQTPETAHLSNSNGEASA